MSTAHAIFRSYVKPREVLRGFKSNGADDGTALGWLFAACGLFFVARLPALSREAHLSDGEVPLFGLALGTFFGTVLLGPIFFYVLAFVVRFICRALGSQMGDTEIRLALFWGLLASAPLVLLQGMMTAFAGPGAQVGLVSAIALIAFLWVWINGHLALRPEQ